jgi:hypothetical protein
MTVWLVAGTPMGQPYPCRCGDVDPDPPAWLIEVARRAGRSRDQIPKCRPYLAQKGKRAGRWWSYCECWGRRRDSGLPVDCCAHHEWNPAYVVTSSLGIATVQQPATVYEASGLPESDDGLDVEDRMVHDWETGLAPYARRWAAAELTCPCATPWDAERDARKMGYHCPGEGCHENFLNWSVAVAHQRFVTMPCKSPASMFDIDGRPVYRARMVGVYVVWSRA